MTERPDRLPRRLTVALARGRVHDRSTRRLHTRRRDRSMDRPPDGRLRRSLRCDHRLAAAERAGARTRTVPARRRPHRLAVPAREASPRHRQPRLEATRRRGVRRHLEQQLARPRPRSRRTRGRRPTARCRCSNVAEPVARVPQLAVHLDRDVNGDGTHPRHAAAPHPGVGCRARRPWASSPSWVARGRRDRQRPGLVGAVPLRRPGRGGDRRRPVAARIGTARQPAVVLGGGHRACIGDTDRPHRRRRPQRPRGGRFVEQHRRRRPVPRIGPGADRGRPRRQPARTWPDRWCRPHASRPTTPTRCTRTTPNATNPATGRS